MVVLNDYLATGHPWEALFENWESEFLQMAAFVLLTTFLIQKGSPPPETICMPPSWNETWAILAGRASSGREGRLAALDGVS
jgi:hypothetical protein